MICSNWPHAQSNLVFSVDTHQSFGTFSKQVTYRGPKQMWKWYMIVFYCLPTLFCFSSCWQHGLELMSVIAVMVNSALIGISDLADRLFPGWGTVERIVFIIFLEVQSPESMHWYKVLCDWWAWLIWTLVEVLGELQLMIIWSGQDFLNAKTGNKEALF